MNVKQIEKFAHFFRKEAQEIDNVDSSQTTTEGDLSKFTKNSNSLAVDAKFISEWVDGHATNSNDTQLLELKKQTTDLTTNADSLKVQTDTYVDTSNSNQANRTIVNVETALGKVILTHDKLDSEHFNNTWMTSTVNSNSPYAEAFIRISDSITYLKAIVQKEKNKGSGGTEPSLPL